MLKNKMYAAVAGASVALALLGPISASAQAIDLTAFNTAVASGTTAATSMAGTYGTYGLLMWLALIAAGIVIYLVVHGARKGKKALQGKF